MDTTGQDAHRGSVNMALITAIVAVATLGGFLFGFDSGVINGTQDGLHQAFRSGEWMQGFEIASMLLGCAVGAFSAGRLADRLGRGDGRGTEIRRRRQGHHREG